MKRDPANAFDHPATRALVEHLSDGDEVKADAIQRSGLFQVALYGSAAMGIPLKRDAVAHSTAQP